MPHPPVISIVMPLYNKETEVERAIQSALAQSFRDYELIIVDDGSTDRGPEIAAATGDSRIRMIHQENAGVSAARNRGIEEARADLVAFLDADDEWKPDFLETILRLRKKFPSCKVFATQYFFCSPNGRRPAIIRGLPAGFRDGVLIDYFNIASRSDPPLWTSATAVDKDAIKELEGFPVGIASGEDLLTWARLAIRHDIAYHNEPKACFWAPVLVSDRPGRVPNIPDFVGDELAKLLKNSDPGGFPGFRRYISLWHRMRAVIFIQLGEGRKAREEVKKAEYYYGKGLKLCILGAISEMPGGLAKKTFTFYRRLNNKMHNL